MKRYKISLVLVLMFILISSFASASFFDFLKNPFSSETEFIIERDNNKITFNNAIKNKINGVNSEDFFINDGVIAFRSERYINSNSRFYVEKTEILEVNGSLVEKKLPIAQIDFGYCADNVVKSVYKHNDFITDKQTILNEGYFYGFAICINNRLVIDVYSFSSYTTSDTEAIASITGDAYVNEQNPNTNYGTSTFLYVTSRDSNRNTRVYISFDLDDGLVNLTSPNQIESAILRISLWDIGSVSNSIDVEYYFCNSSINENTITWNNQATQVPDCEATPIRTHPHQIQADDGDWYLINITDSLINNERLKGTVKIVMNPESFDSTDRFQQWNSKEFSEALSPRVVVTYSDSDFILFANDSASNLSINNFTALFTQGANSYTFNTTTGSISFPFNNFLSRWKLDDNFGANETGGVKDVNNLNNGQLFGKTFNHGTVSGGVTIEDGAVVFDGSTGYVNTNFNVQNNINDSFSINVWFKTHNSDEEYSIFEANNVAPRMYIRSSTTDNRLITRWGDTSINIDNAFTIGQWDNIIITFNRLTNEISFWSNGNPIVTNIPVVNFENVNQAIRLGRAGPASALHLDGKIATFNIFKNKILSESEISAIYNAGRNAYSPISDGLVAQYSGKDSDWNGSVVNTIYDTNHLSPSPVSWLNASMNFDGVSDYVEIPHNEKLTGFKEASWSFWYKENSLVSSSGFLDKYATTGNKREWRFFRNGVTTSLTFGYSTDGTVGTFLRGDSAIGYLSSTGFNFYTITFDNGLIKFYKNGEFHSQDGEKTNKIIYASDMPVVIGKRQSDNLHFNGSIADIRIFDYALSDLEINSLYTGSDLYNVTVSANNYSDNVTLNFDFGLFTSLFVNLDPNPMENFILISPDNDFTDENEYNITWTQAVSPTNKPVSYLVEVLYQNQSQVFNTTTSDLFYNLNITTFHPSDYIIKVTATELYTNQSYSHNSTLKVDKENKVTFLDETTTDPLINRSVTITYPNSNSYEFITNENGSVFFSSYDNLESQEGVYKIRYNNHAGYVTPITFTVNFTQTDLPFDLTYNISQTNIDLSIFYRATGSLFNKSADIIFQGVGNFTTSNGTFSFSNISLASGTYIVQVKSDGYFTEQKQLIYINQENSDLSFYLLEANGTTSNTITVKVLDSSQSFMQGALVNVLEYDLNSLSYKSISQGLTNSNGEAIFLIELNDKTYKIEARKTVNGLLLEGNSGDEGIIFRDEIAGGSPITFEKNIVTIYLSSTERFISDVMGNLVYSITENFNRETNISTISAEFHTKDGSDTTVCIEFFGNRQSLVSYCSTGNSGTVTPTTPFLLNLSKNIVAEVYMLDNNGNKIILETFRYASSSSLQETLRLYAILSPFMLFLWVAIISIGLYSGVLPIVAILGIVLAIVEVALFPNFMTGMGMVLKILICFQLLYFGRKKEDFT